MIDMSREGLISLVSRGEEAIGPIALALWLEHHGWHKRPEDLSDAELRTWVMLLGEIAPLVYEYQQQRRPPATA